MGQPTVAECYRCDSWERKSSHAHAKDLFNVFTIHATVLLNISPVTLPIKMRDTNLPDFFNKRIDLPKGVGRPYRQT